MSLLPTKLGASRGARTDGGFGVVEVVIAVLLIMVVTSGLVLAMSGGNKLRGAARLQASLTHSGQAMLEKLSNDNSWMKSCTVATSPCSIAPVLTADPGLLKLEDVDGTVQVVAGGASPTTGTNAVAVDSDADGKGDLDADGVIPDYYQVQVVIQPDAATAARYGGTPAALQRTFTTSLDQNGNTLQGSLRIDACVALDQADERMSIDGCAETGVTRIKMEDCPPNPPKDDSNFDRCREAYDWAKPALQTGSPNDPSTYVSLRRVAPSTLNFSIRNLSTGGPAIPSSKAKVVDGSFVFENIDTGTYRISGLPGSYTIGGDTYVRWNTKEVPAYHDAPGGSVGVQPGIKNHALVMFRPPKPAKDGIDFYFDRLVHHYNLVKDEWGPEKSSGPFSLAGNQWVPTDTYEGNGAEDFCAARMKPLSSTYSRYDGATKDGSDIWESDKYYKTEPDADGKLSKVHQQCWIYKTGYASSNQSANCHLAAFRIEFYDLPNADAALSDTYLGLRLEYTMRYCTYYRNELTHTYWHASKLPDSVLPGAVKTAVYEVSPRPTTREIDFGPGGGLQGSSYPRHLCIVQGHTTHQNAKDQSSCTPGKGIDKLDPGLNTQVIEPADAVVPSGSNTANSYANRNVINFPAWAVSGGLWVRPNGSIVGGSANAKTTIADPTIKLRGDGECYWRGGPYLPQEWEGKCGSCSITWDKNTSFNNTCAMLSKTCTARYILETEEFSDGWNSLDGVAPGGRVLETTGPYNVPPMGGGKNGCINYKPEWPCTSLPPSIYNGNCKPYKPAPPVNLSAGTYKVSQGTAGVGTKPANADPGVS